MYCVTSVRTSTTPLLGPGRVCICRPTDVWVIAGTATHRSTSVAHHHRQKMSLLMIWATLMCCKGVEAASSRDQRVDVSTPGLWW